MKILYLEDNNIDIELTQRALTKAFPGCNLINARTIADAEKILRRTEDFDLLLLDLNLPDGNGLDLLKYVGGVKLPVPVVILTGIKDEEIAVSALKLGADDYVPKTRGYLKKLPEVINFAIINFKKKHFYATKIIKVLYVEWHLADIDFTVRHFKRYAPNFEIITVTNVKDALELVSNTSNENADFDILLMDYRLPGINALEAVKLIRQQLKLEIPFVLVTGQGSEEIVVQALKLGADDYIIKRENYLLRLPSVLLSVYQKHQLVNMQQELLKSKEQYKSFFEDDLTGDFISTLDGKILNCNQAFLEICGFSSKEEALNYDIRKIYAEKDARNKIIESVKKEKRLQFLEADLRRPDGKTINVIGNMVGGFDEKGNLQTLKGYIFDDTERKKLLDELRKLSRAIEQSPASVMITDLQGNIEYVNQKFTQVTGYLPEEVIGRNPRILKSGKQPAKVYKEMWQTITAGKDWFGELLNKKKDGSLFWELVSISSIKRNNGDISHYLAVKEDITDKKQKELELVQAKEKAEESDRLKTAFLHNISHEIRTPMNAIVGFSNLLKDPDVSLSRRKKFSDIITKSSAQLLGIITDIIDIVSIEAGQEKVHERKININAVLKLVYEQFKVKAAAKNLELSLNMDLPAKEAEIITDETKLFQILTNLVGNAIKFTNKGSVNFGYVVKDEKIEFYVKDTGIGIPKNMHKKIFDRFRQAEKSTAQLFGGSGLGLSISKAYVKLLNGSIWVESEVGKGSHFYVTIPLKYPSKKSIIKSKEIKKKQELDATKQITVLVAEDEDFNYMLLTELLAKTNIQVVRAINGEEAVEICKSNPNIDIILMDIKMPKLNGIEATTQIRTFLPNLPIIAQTAYATAEDKKLIKESGFNTILTKPFKKNDLIANINELLVKKE